MSILIKVEIKYCLTLFIRFPAAADFIDLCADLCEAAAVVFV